VPGPGARAPAPSSTSSAARATLAIEGQDGVVVRTSCRVGAW
jgi:hypothetical protein